MADTDTNDSATDATDTPITSSATTWHNPGDTVNSAENVTTVQAPSSTVSATTTVVLPGNSGFAIVDLSVPYEPAPFGVPVSQIPSSASSNFRASSAAARFPPAGIVVGSPPFSSTSSNVSRLASSGGTGPILRVGPPDPERLIDALTVPESGPQGPFNGDDFNMVGVFSVEWLSAPAYTALLDNMAASPGAFNAVRVFGVLSSGNFAQETSDLAKPAPGVWSDLNAKPDFTLAISGLAQLALRGLTPFIVLGFFPSALSPMDQITPQPTAAFFANWRTLVAAFLDALWANFHTQINNWWFEVWNEPNVPSFWSSDTPIPTYIDLYDHTSQVVSGFTKATLRLGGPAILVDSDPADLTGRQMAIDQIDEFLTAVAGRQLRCDFVSFHEKGSTITPPNEIHRQITYTPLELQGLYSTAEQVGLMASARLGARIDPPPPRHIFNNEADSTFPLSEGDVNRLTHKYAAWQTAVCLAHDALSSQYSQLGIQFHAGSDNAHLDLASEPFTSYGRSIMTPANFELATDTKPGIILPLRYDLFKLPVYGFHELLRLLQGQHGVWLSGASAVFPNTPLFWASVYGVSFISNLFTVHPLVDSEPVSKFSSSFPINNLYIEGIAWSSINVTWFSIGYQGSDGSYSAAAPIVKGNQWNAGKETRVRNVQELPLLARRVNQKPNNGTYSTGNFTIGPFETRLLWITKYTTVAPKPVDWLAAVFETDDASGISYVVMLWKPSADPTFYSYALFLRNSSGERVPLANVANPLRAAIWVDMPTVRGTSITYGVEVLSASGFHSVTTWAPPVTIPP